MTVPWDGTDDEIANALADQPGPPSPFWDRVDADIARSDPEVAWRKILTILRVLQDDQSLCWFGSSTLEGFITEFPELTLQKLEEAKSIRNFRVALSCVIWPQEPAELDAALWAAVPARGSAEDAGHRKI
jgi:hypothetical protein